MGEKKVLTLDNLDAVVKKIKGDFATKKELEEACTPTYATDEECVNLFADSAGTE